MSSLKDTHLDLSWKELPTGGAMQRGGSSLDIDTGEWRVMIPAWHEEKCKQCFLCNPVCADSSIPIAGDKRLDFDFMHCKGCGVCFKVCPFGAITFEKEAK